ncbi:phytanoyl-CoA dioxygenase family protein [Mycolicibacterium sp.]|uniref:phytanoyl-CoA dioxygenase family protein n=1 Tax=Mycolicibacterium sp. TaxID=2320850 RepID=UPI0037CA3681
MQLATLPNTATSAEVIASLEHSGGVIVSNFVSDDTLVGLERDLRPKLDSLAFGNDPYFSGTRTRRLGALFKHTRHAADIARQPHFRAAAEHYLRVEEHIYLGEDQVKTVPTMQIGVTQVIDIYPGEGKQPLHRDDSVWQWRHPHGGRQARVQVMVAVTDFTADNGGTLVIPGSHLWDDRRPPTIDEAVPTVMSAGSALIWLGGTYHAGGENRSATSRTGITMTLDLGYLRQEENHYLALTFDEVAALPDDIRRLLGYQACEPTCGWIEHEGVMRDPSFLFEDSDGTAEQVSMGTRSTAEPVA